MTDYQLGPVETFADLRSVNITDANASGDDKVLISVLYRSTIDDGYGAEFIFNWTSTEDDNNTTIIKPNSITGAGRWIVWGGGSGGGGSGPGGKQNLSETLGIGNATDGYNIQMTSGDAITASDNMVVVDANLHVIDDGYFGDPIDTSIDSATLGNVRGGDDFSVWGKTTSGTNQLVLLLKNDQLKFGDNVVDPNEPQEVATKNYSDTHIASVDTNIASTDLTDGYNGYVITYVQESESFELAPGIDFVTLDGDVTGPAHSNTVEKIQNRNVSTTAPDDGYVLAWNAAGDEWEPTDPESLITLAGDVSGPAASNSINNHVVTLPKLVQASTASILLGRGSSGAGDYQEITLGTNLSMSGTTLNATGGGGGGVGTWAQVLAQGNTADGYAVVLNSGSYLTAGSTPASSGTIRLSADQKISWRNGGDSGDISIVSSSGNNLSIGDTTYSQDMSLNLGSSGTLTVNFGTSSYFTADTTKLNLRDKILSFGTTPSTSGVITLSNNTGIGIRNAGNSADLNLIKGNASNNIVIGDNTGTAGVVLGVLSGGTYSLQVNGANEYIFDSSKLDVANNKIVNLADPTDPQDAVNLRTLDGYAFSSLPIAGDVTGTLAATTVVKLRNRTLSNSAPNDGNVITWDAGTSTWITNGHFIDVGNNYIKFGSSSASTGTIRGPSGFNISALNQGGTGNITVIQSAFDAITVGDATNTNGINLISKSGSTVDLYPGGFFEYRFAFNTADFTNNNLVTDGYLGTGHATIATAGNIRLKSADTIQFRNAANTGNLITLATDSSDNVLLGNTTNVANIRYGVKTGGSHDIRINNTTEYLLDATNANFTANNILTDGYIATGHDTIASQGNVRFKNLDTLYVRNSGNTDDMRVLETGDNLSLGDGRSTGNLNLYYDVKTGGTHIFRVAGTDEYTYTGTTADFKSNILLNPLNIQFPGTGVSSIASGLIRVPHASTIVVGRDSTNSFDREILRWGVAATDEVTLGNTSTDTWLHANNTVGFYINGAQEYRFGRTKAEFIDNVIEIGSAPSHTGTMRFSNLQTIYTRNADDTDDQRVLEMGDNLSIGDGTSTGNLNLYYDIRTGGSHIIRVNNTDEYVLTSDQMDCKNNNILTTGYLQVGTNPASSGALRIPNNTSLVGRDSTNSSNIPIITLSGADNVVVGDTTANDVSLVAGTSSKIRFFFNTTAKAEMTAGSMDFKTMYLDMQAQTAPGAPASGFRLYVNSADGKLYAISAAGHTTVLASP